MSMDKDGVSSESPLHSHGIINENFPVNLQGYTISQKTIGFWLFLLPFDLFKDLINSRFGDEERELGIFSSTLRGYP